MIIGSASRQIYASRQAPPIKFGQHRAHPVGIGGCRERQQGYGLAVEDRWEPSTTKLWGTLIRAIVSLV